MLAKSGRFHQPFAVQFHQHFKLKTSSYIFFLPNLIAAFKTQSAKNGFSFCERKKSGYNVGEIDRKKDLMGFYNTPFYPLPQPLYFVNLKLITSFFWTKKCSDS